MRSSPLPRAVRRHGRPDGGRLVNDRALNLKLFEGVEETALDLYSAVRNGYLQRWQQVTAE